MFVGEVIGNLVSTRKNEKLVGCKLLVVRPVPLAGEGARPPLVAVDTVGAGLGERVLVVEGSSARAALGKPDAPVDALIAGIIDSIEIREG